MTPRWKVFADCVIAACMFVAVAGCVATTSPARPNDPQNDQGNTVFGNLRVARLDVSDAAVAIRRLYRDAVRVAFDSDKSGIYLSGTRNDVTEAIQLLVEMDRDLEKDIAAPLPVQIIISLKHAKATEVAAIFDRMVQQGFWPKPTGIITSADERTNTLLMQCDEAYEPRFRELIERLDSPAEPAK